MVLSPLLLLLFSCELVGLQIVVDVDREGKDA
jgi:hypothetical protein